MITLTATAIAGCLGATCVHLLGIALTSVRCRVRDHVQPMSAAPAVTIIRPVCRVDNFEC